MAETRKEPPIHFNECSGKAKRHGSALVVHPAYTAPSVYLSPDMVEYYTDVLGIIYKARVWDPSVVGSRDFPLPDNYLLTIKVESSSDDAVYLIVHAPRLPHNFVCRINEVKFRLKGVARVEAASPLHRDLRKRLGLENTPISAEHHSQLCLAEECGNWMIFRNDFFWWINADDAERLLQQLPTGAFVTRFSTQGGKSKLLPQFTLSIVSESAVEHHRIANEDQLNAVLNSKPHGVFPVELNWLDHPQIVHFWKDQPEAQ